MARRPYPENIPFRVREALDIFSDEEIESLRAFFDDNTREFLGIGTWGPGNCMTFFSEPEKVVAIDVLNNQMRLELRMQHRTWVNKVMSDWEIPNHTWDIPKDENDWKNRFRQNPKT